MTSLLENNNLVGVIPEEIKALTGLELLDLSDNKLERSLPTEMPENLKELDVERNLLQGNPFNSVANLGGSLEALKVSSNFMTGTIPASISQLTGLTALWMAENRFEGVIPTEVGLLTNLGTFAMLAKILFNLFVAITYPLLCLFWLQTLFTRTPIK